MATGHGPENEVWRLMAINSGRLASASRGGKQGLVFAGFTCPFWRISRSVLQVGEMGSGGSVVVFAVIAMKARLSSLQTVSAKIFEETPQQRPVTQALTNIKLGIKTKTATDPPPFLVGQDAVARRQNAVRSLLVCGPRGPCAPMRDITVSDRIKGGGGGKKGKSEEDFCERSMASWGKDKGLRNTRSPEWRQETYIWCQERLRESKKK
ncbi:hypothetical protein BaRGS_00013332 [Batillaria attramentaria]|uniref:Uncharacterized protein n=1 Tax=Batillaria attramentaria TaxID=370345 RepID=A0ABD0L7Y5_9CAEN